MVRRIIDKIRQNHAVEHGTVAVLLERGTRPPLAGNATPGGFYIYAKVSTDDVSSAAAEALRRLRSGERELAVSPHCGTNLVVGALLAAIIAGVLMRRSGRRLMGLPAFAAAIVGSSLFGRPIGEMVQRHYTTLADVEDLEITGIRRFEIAGLTVHKVHTGRRRNDVI